MKNELYSVYLRFKLYKWYPFKIWFFNRIGDSLSRFLCHKWIEYKFDDPLKYANTEGFRILARCKWCRTFKTSEYIGTEGKIILKTG